MSTVVPVPDVGPTKQRPLQFFWIADYSGSMSGKKIAILNQAIREALQPVRDAVAAHTEVSIMMRAIKFADSAEWHVGPDPVSVEKFVWPELNVAGGTATAQALRLLAGELTMEKMPRRGYPPVCILISDGFCTDPPEEYEAAIAELKKLPWGQKSVRLAIAVGDPADYDENALLKFVSHPEIGVLKADTPAKLVEYIRWASVAASIGSAAGKSKLGGSEPDSQNVILAALPAEQPAVTSNKLDVF